MKKNLAVTSRDVRERFDKHSQMERDAWAKVAIYHALQMEKDPANALARGWARNIIISNWFGYAMFIFATISKAIRDAASYMKSLEEWKAVNDFPVILSPYKKRKTWRDIR